MIKVYKLDGSGVETLLGADDGVGNLVGSGITSGNIVYSSGVFSIITVANIELGEYLVFRFEQNNIGDLKQSLVCRNEQIFDVERTEITVNYG